MDVLELALDIFDRRPDLRVSLEQHLYSQQAAHIPARAAVTSEWVNIQLQATRGRDDDVATLAGIGVLWDPSAWVVFGDRYRERFAGTGPSA